MKRFPIFLLLLLLCSVAHGQEVPKAVQWSAQFGCIITVPSNSSGGSGILIQTSSTKDGYVLTAGHLFDGTRKTKDVLALLDFGNGEKWKAYLESIDMRNGKDQAVLKIPNMLSRTKMLGAPPATEALKPGDTVYYWGYDYRKAPRGSGGVHPATYFTGRIVDGDGYSMEVTGRSISGMSGGPVLNESGEVVSAISATTGDPSGQYNSRSDRMVCTASNQTVGFLRGLLTGGVPGIPFGGRLLGDCQDGNCYPQQPQSVLQAPIVQSPILHRHQISPPQQQPQIQQQPLGQLPAPAANNPNAGAVQFQPSTPMVDVTPRLNQIDQKLANNDARLQTIEANVQRILQEVAKCNCEPGQIIQQPAPIIQPPPIIQQPAPIAQPQPQIIQQPIQGERGAAGARGPPGKDAFVNEESIVNKVLSRMPAPQRGERGPAGKDGIGQQGPPGRDGQVTDEQLAAITAAALQMIKQDPDWNRQLPIKQIKIVNADTGELLVETELDVNNADDIVIPYRPDTPSSFGVSDVSEEMIAAIVEKLPPITLRPGWEDPEDGQVKAVPGMQLLARVGGDSILPPMKLQVIDPAGDETVTQGPLGGTLVIDMEKLK